jgi:hypothetical protein
LHATNASFSLDANETDVLQFAAPRYIAPQIASEVKEFQRRAKMTFNQIELRVIMRLLVC